MPFAGSMHLDLKRFPQHDRQDGHAILGTLAIAHDNMTLAEINVLNPQAETFEKPQARAVEDPADQPVGIGEKIPQALDFIPCENDGNANRTFGTFERADRLEVNAKHVAVHEDKCIEGLILCGSADLSIRGEVGEEGVDFSCAHLLWVAFGMP